MTQQEAMKIAVSALDSKKAEDIRVIKVGDITVIADYFIIADGTSTTQLKTLADEVEYQLKESGLEPLRVQGTGQSNWIIIDYGDIVVHVFRKDMREFYNLERLWRDGEEVDISAYLT